MKIAQANGDHRDEDEERQIEVQAMRKAIGEPTFEYEYKQNDVDSWVVFLSTSPLMVVQLDQLWQHGDLWAWDVIEGANFVSCLAELDRKTAEFCADD